MAFDTTLAPVVGQQVTLSDASEADALARADLLRQRALTSFVWPGGDDTSECDLVARGVVEGIDRGYLLGSDGLFRSDRRAEAAISYADLTSLATSGSAILTLTCVPPGSGPRLAYDRDEDGTRDRDELDDDDDPTARAFVDLPELSFGDEPPVSERDGGMNVDGSVSSDAGSDARDGGLDASIDPGDEGNCNCRLGVGRSKRGPWALLLLVAFALGAGRRRRDWR